MIFLLLIKIVRTVEIIVVFQVNSPIMKGSSFGVDLSFTNPLPVAIKGAAWILEASRGAKPKHVNHMG